MQKQRMIILSVGIVLAVFTVMMIRNYLSNQREIALEEAKKQAAENAQQRAQAAGTPVVVAARDIPEGSLINPQDIEVKVFPNQYIQPQAITSAERIIGMPIGVAVAAGEQLTLSKFSAAKQRASLSEITPAGKRAVTVIVDNAASLAGLIKPGDYVDVIGVVPMPEQAGKGKAGQTAVMPLFQNILVLAVGQEVGAKKGLQYQAKKPEKEKKEAITAITIALDPEQANLISFVQDQGKIRLVLRSASDTAVETTKPANWDTLLKYVTPEEETKPKAPVPTVEVYRGLKKENVPLSN